jgi:hypothetical protein
MKEISDFGSLRSVSLTGRVARPGASNRRTPNTAASMCEIEMADTDKRHGFFAVDRRTWARVCGLGLNAAVVYLVLARGTGKSNRESAWSVLAIESYTGISRSRAHKAISALMADGVVRKLRDGTRPKYELKPWRLIPALTLGRR